MITELLAQVRADLEHAWDRAVALGWPTDRLEVRIGTEDSYGTQGRVMLVVKRASHDELDRAAFEASITVRGDHYWLASRWIDLPDAPAIDLDAVDRAALARMFPRWDQWSDQRSAKGTIRRRRAA